MAHPHCPIKEAAVGQFCNRVLVALAGVAWIFCLDEQQRYLTVQIGIIRFVLEDLSIELKRFSPLAQASPAGGSCRFFHHLASIVVSFAVKQRHQYRSVALYGCPICRAFIAQEILILISGLLSGDDGPVCRHIGDCYVSKTGGCEDVAYLFR